MRPRVRRAGERGVALAMVLVAAVLVSITAAIALNVSGHRLHRAQMLQQHDTTYYLDEAAMQWAFIKLGKNLRPFNDPVSWPKWPAPGSVRTETITVGGRSVTINVTHVADDAVFGRSPPQFKIDIISQF